MPRTARIAPKEFVYHVLTRGNNKHDIFKNEEDFKKYIDILWKYKTRYKYKLYHYVLMTNHVHLVIETMEDGGELSQIMKGINLSYALHYKKKYSHTGHFWQDRFKSIIIAKDEYLLACGSYVELNPVRAGMVKDPKDYPWSSYKANAYGGKDDLIDKHIIFDNLSTDETARKEYRAFVQQMQQNHESMRGEMEKRTIYGGSEFIQRLNKRYKIDAVIKKRGRPKRESPEKPIK
ncbi:MAG: transposase [Thermodesulfobacteriota bacterium]|nr:transposase [Thermodesulfobacteriota bacterium]